MKLPIYALLGITSLTFACGGDEGEKIETSQVHKIVAQNTESTLNSTLTNANFLENSDLIEKFFGATGQTCSTGSGGDTICNPRELNLDLDAMKLNRTEVSDLLRKTIFQDANVETSTETEITYLIAGESVCGEADPTMFPSECITQVDKAQIRLRVTSPEPNAVDIDVLVGPDRDNPISVEFHDDLLAVEADLDGIDGAIGYLESKNLIGDEENVLPTIFSGRVRAEVKIDGPQKVSASVSVLRAIDIAGGDYGLKIGANEPTLQVTLDGAAEVISVLADLGKTDVRFQENNETWEFSVAGVDGRAALSAQSDSLVFTGVGFGDDQSTLKIDGSQAISFDFNADSNRHIDFTASPNADGVKLDFADSVKVALGLSFDGQDAPEYVKDDVLNIELKGDKPSLIAQNGEIIKLLAGSLKFSLEKAGDSIEVTTGQCISPVADDVVVKGEGEAAVESNIIEDMAIIACE